MPQVRIRTSPERANVYGMTPAKVVEAVEALSKGRVVGQIVEGSRHFDLVVRFKDDERTTDGLKATLIHMPAGYVPPSYLAEVEKNVGLNQVLRESGQRRIILCANGGGVRDAATFATPN